MTHVPAAKKKKYECVFCDEEINVEHFKNLATPDQVFSVLALYKICTPHATDVHDTNQKREIERTVS